MCLACEAPGLRNEEPPIHMAGGQEHAVEYFAQVILDADPGTDPAMAYRIAQKITAAFRVDLQQIDLTPIFEPGYVPALRLVLKQREATPKRQDR
jgi:hypothetical protein